VAVRKVFIDNCSKRDSFEASQYEKETGYSEKKRQTDLDRKLFMKILIMSHACACGLWEVAHVDACVYCDTV
jgi:hypothetical protein